ncbi:hypothetical protein ACJMK2_036537 [Sinanodonta woodiana]|uniref:Sushi domain-containing protein n=1 Tax=Sinanodonta woodiana TaxID=1069815 RepID=A0ABD3WHW1_SINWO
MNGDDLITCMADRTWSPEPPTCVKVICPEFSTPDAQIFQDFSGVRNEFGSKNKITCTGGTVLQGPQYITCLANKTWSGSPSCTVPNCGNPPASYEPCTEVFYTDGNTNIGSQVEVICLENAVAFGTSPFLICGATGSWSHEYHCLCGCIVDNVSVVYTGIRSVKHNSTINWKCQDGINSVVTCWNGTFIPSINCTKVATTTASTTIPLISSTEFTTASSSFALKTIVKGSNRVADIKDDAENSLNTVRNISDSTTMRHGIITNMLIFNGIVLSLMWKTFA